MYVSSQAVELALDWTAEGGCPYKTFVRAAVPTKTLLGWLSPHNLWQMESRERHHGRNDAT